jgi:hypothetical protein
MTGIWGMKELVGAVALVCVAAGIAPTRAEDDDTAGRIDALFSEWDSTRTPGCAVAVPQFPGPNTSPKPAVGSAYMTFPFNMLEI